MGSVISVTPPGQRTLQSTIVELAENQAYAYETSFNGLTLAPGPAKQARISARK